VLGYSNVWEGEKIMSRRNLIALLAVLFTLGGCATWDGMTQRERSAAVGAGVGGVGGAVVTDGSVLGTVGGAAIGGVVGDQVGRRQ
jgi:osmotically inducible lipoprotein OsmB